MHLHLGACQTPVLNEPEQLDSLLATLAERQSPTLWQFPELFMGGFEYARKQDMVALSDRARELLRRFCRDTGNLAAGSFWEKSGQDYLNSFILFTPDSETRLYVKMHPFPGIAEAEHFTPGRAAPSTYSYNGVKFCPIVCFDLRFPELFRLVPDADVYLVCAQWPAVRTAHWLCLNTARAIENQSYVLAVNASGPSALGELAGNSVLISAWGEQVFNLGEPPGTASARFDPELLAKARKPFGSRKSPHIKIELDTGR